MTAPMPGVVLEIFVAAGDVVTKGTPLLILEAMKMEHQIAAPYDGVVEAVHCAKGDLVQPGVDLISLIAADGES
jgi:3-methylcrotonyl-CoA carboxylase alpha subunit